MWSSRSKEADPRPCGYPPGAEPFLAAICAERDDDTHRLVFADWLQENGDDDRAEFIRLQCELSRVRPSYGVQANRDEFAPDERAKFDRQAELLKKNAAVWTGGFPREMFVLPIRPFARGLPRAAYASPAQWREYGGRVRTWIPVDEVQIEGGAERYPDLMALPTLLGLSGLVLTRATTDELRALVHSSALDSLAALYVVGRDWNGTLETPTLRALFGSPRLARLRDLHLTLDRAGDTLGFVVSGSLHLRNLRTVHISTGMSAEGARDLFDSPNLANVTRLQLPDNPVGDAAIRGLVRSKYLTKLVALNLSDASLTAESGRLLAGWPGLRTVNELRLDGNELGMDGLRALSESPHLERLQSMQLAGNVNVSQMSAVHALPGFARVKLF